MTTTLSDNIRIDPPQVIETSAQPIALIHITVPREAIREVMGPGLQELRETLAAQGIEITGPWFTHHFRRPGETFDFEICVPVAAQVKPAGRVQAGQIPAMSGARTVYHGSYEGLGAAWGELDAWVIARGHTPMQDLWECYLAGPESSSDPTLWRTELTRPLAAA